MSGLVGRLSFDGRPAAVGDVQRMAAAAPHPRAAEQQFRVCGPFAIGFQNASDPPEPAARPLPSGDLIVACDGWLDPTGAIPPSGSAAIAEAYRKSGDSFATMLDGEYAAALFEPSRCRLILVRDVMGARPLFYARSKHGIVFASEIKALLCDVAPEPDPETLAEVVLDRWDDDHRTPFKHVRSVAPGKAIAITSGGEQLLAGRCFDPQRQIRYRRYGDYVEHFGVLFADAVRRRLDGARRTAVFVSGGVDSSAVFSVAHGLSAAGRAAPLGISLTFARNTPADEDAFVRALEAHASATMMRVPISEYHTVERGAETVALLDSPAIVPDTQLRLCTAAGEAGCRSALDGYYGDQLVAGRAYLIDLVQRGRLLRAARDLRGWAAWTNDVPRGFYIREMANGLARSAVPPAVWPWIKGNAAAARRRRYAPFYTDAFLAPLFDLQMSRFPPMPFPSRHAERTYRDATAGHYRFHSRIHAQIAARCGVDLSSPFRDRALVEYVMAIPGEVVSREGVPKRLLRDAVRDRLPASILTRRTKADFTGLSNDAYRRGFDDVCRVLSRGCVSVQAGLIDPDALARYQQYARGALNDDTSAETGWQLGEALALELWLRRYVQPADLRGNQ